MVEHQSVDIFQDECRVTCLHSKGLAAGQGLLKMCVRISIRVSAGPIKSIKVYFCRGQGQGLTATCKRQQSLLFILREFTVFVNYNVLFQTSFMGQAHTARIIPLSQTMSIFKTKSCSNCPSAITSDK